MAAAMDARAFSRPRSLSALHRVWARPMRAAPRPRADCLPAGCWNDCRCAGRACAGAPRFIRVGVPANPLPGDRSICARLAVRLPPWSHGRISCRRWRDHSCAIGPGAGRRGRFPRLAPWAWSGLTPTWIVTRRDKPHRHGARNAAGRAARSDIDIHIDFPAAWAAAGRFPFASVPHRCAQP